MKKERHCPNLGALGSLTKCGSTMVWSSLTARSCPPSSGMMHRPALVGNAVTLLIWGMSCCRSAHITSAGRAAVLHVKCLPCHRGSVPNHQLTLFWGSKNPHRPVPTTSPSLSIAYQPQRGTTNHNLNTHTEHRAPRTVRAPRLTPPNKTVMGSGLTWPSRGKETQPEPVLHFVVRCTPSVGESTARGADFQVSPPFHPPTTAFSGGKGGVGTVRCAGIQPPWTLGRWTGTDGPAVNDRRWACT